MMYTLQNENLRISVVDPAEVQNWTCRFDYTGYISEVVLNDSVYFAASEPRSQKIPSSGGRGLCSAYRFDAFNEVKTGEWAPRFGVGLLKKKSEEKFQNSEKYECIPFPCEVKQISDTELQFRTLPKACLGYAAETRRTIRIQANCLYMDMEFENVGEREITFGEFCHNFLTMNGMAVGPDYLLELPQVQKLQENAKKGVFADTYYQFTEHSLRPKEYSIGFSVFDVKGPDLGNGASFQWRLSHEDAQIAVEGTEYYLPSEMTVWSKDHMICPETTFMANVQPGESVAWHRSWKFEELG